MRKLAKPIAAIVPIRSLAIILGLLSSPGINGPAVAGYNVDSLLLLNLVQDSSGPSIVQDADRITDILNPLQLNSTAQLADNIAASSYDYSWLEDAGIGDFHTTFDHEMRFTSDVRTVTRVELVIETTADVMVAFEGSLAYSHTPGDFTDIGIGYSVVELSQFDVLLNEALEGGNGDFLPASGTLDLTGDVILPAGFTYRLSATVDNFNILIDDPVGIYDAEGFANFTIRPVPEPHVAWLFIVSAAIAVVRRRR